MAGGSAQSSVQSSTVIKQKLSINISEVNYIISHDKKKLQPPYFFVATGENPLPNFIGNIIDKVIYLTYWAHNAKCKMACKRLTFNPNFYSPLDVSFHKILTWIWLLRVAFQSAYKETLSTTLIGSKMCIISYFENNESHSHWYIRVINTSNQ